MYNVKKVVYNYINQGAASTMRYTIYVYLHRSLLNKLQINVKFWRQE
jgi:hypothetical protein